MEIDKSDALVEPEERDSFIKFIECAKSTLCPNAVESQDSPGWSWIAHRILRTCVTYSSGVTPAILLSELSLAWNEHNKSGAPKKRSDCVAKLKKKRKRSTLPNTITIDSIYEKRFLSLNSIIEAVIVNAFVLPGTDIYMLTLGDVWSSNTIDLYLHRRFYNIADLKNGILRNGREVLLTGCYLRVTAGKSLSAHLLPTEYFVVLLDEDEDDDAMLLGAQFCSDSFSSVSLDSVKGGASYSLYARIEHIGLLEVQGKYGSLQRKQITLVDNDGMQLKFLLWGDQVLVANLLSVGSMLAIERPFIANAMDSSLETSSEICLEYGSATQLYLVPILLHKEQVSIALTQNHYQGSRLLPASKLSQGPTVSQVTLPCDSQGTIDFSNYPFRSYVVDLCDKMTGISLYGVITDIRASRGIFSLRIEDKTGAIWTRLHFVRYWSLGRLTMGHIIYITGLSSSLTPQKSLELSWHENGTGSSFFNLSCLPAFLNSSCLHRLLPLSDLSTHTCGVQVCRVWVDHIDECQLDTTFMHTCCGHIVESAGGGEIECSFCHRSCSDDVQRTFRLMITLADETGKVLGRCTGQTATEMLQISPDEFYELAEEEQIMYPTSLEHEKFIVAIASWSWSGRRGKVDWEITLALKCE